MSLLLLNSSDNELAIGTVLALEILLLWHSTSRLVSSNTRDLGFFGVEVANLIGLAAMSSFWDNVTLSYPTNELRVDCK